MLFMTNDKGILIRNIYYMLSYAFQELSQNNYEYIQKEEFEQELDLFAEILYKGVASQLKQGLYREYIQRKDGLPLLRGRLDVNETIRYKIGRQNRLGCEYDELSENNIFNQIVKSTLLLLVRNKSVHSKRKSQLHTILPFFAHVDEVTLNDIRWDMLQYQRNNQSYRMLMNICYFIIDGMLMTTETGNYRMPTFSDEHMARLYERFVLEYYRTHHKYLRPNSDNIDWNIRGVENRIIEFLPAMCTDITLYSGNKTLIIDTKYYRHMTQNHLDKHTIHSGNMYQIFAYVKNLDSHNTGNVSGMLLYAKTDEDIVPDLDEVIDGSRFLVKTLDLNAEFSQIALQLDNIVEQVLVAYN